MATVSTTTWNPSDCDPNITLSNGNLTATPASTSGWKCVRGTKGKTTGKWYFSAQITGSYSTDSLAVGIVDGSTALNVNPGSSSTGWVLWRSVSTMYLQNNGSNTSQGSYNAQNLILRCAVDLDLGTVYFGYGNNVVYNVYTKSPAYSNVSGIVYPVIGFYGTASRTGIAHFSQTDQLAWYPAFDGFTPWDFDSSDWTLQKVNPYSFVMPSGRFRIAGTVTELGVPGRYRVCLFARSTGRVLQQTWSNINGSYEFRDISYIANGYTVIAFDHGDNPLNAAIADLVTPEPMP